MIKIHNFNQNYSFLPPQVGNECSVWSAPALPSPISHHFWCLARDKVMCGGEGTYLPLAGAMLV